MKDPFWHDQNPWNDDLIYVPIEELADACLLIGTRVGIVKDHSSKVYTRQDVLDHWNQYGPNLDPYILPRTHPTAGVRYGPEGSEYLSTGFSETRLKELIRKYKEEK